MPDNDSLHFYQRKERGGSRGEGGGVKEEMGEGGRERGSEEGGRWKGEEGERERGERTRRGRGRGMGRVMSIHIRPSAFPDILLVLYEFLEYL